MEQSVNNGSGSVIGQMLIILRRLGGVLSKPFNFDLIHKACKYAEQACKYKQREGKNNNNKHKYTVFCKEDLNRSPKHPAKILDRTQNGVI